MTEQGMTTNGRSQRVASFLSRIVFGLILVTTVLAVIPYGLVDAWLEAAFECVVFFLVAIWVVESLVQGNWQLDRVKILLPVALLTLYAFFQTLNLPGITTRPATGLRVAEHALTIDRYQTHLTAVKMLALTLFAALALVHTSTPKRLRWLVRLVIGVGLASAIFGILRQLLQSPLSTTGFVLPLLYYHVGYGQFISSNVFAFLMELAFGMLLGLVLGSGVRRQLMPIYLAIGLVIWAALILSNSRGGVLGFLCQTVFTAFIALGWFWSRRTQREGGVISPALNRFSTVVRILAIGLLFGVLVTGVLWMGGDSLAGKTSEQVGIDGVTRREIWHSTWELIKQHPVTGVGFGAYFLAIPEYQMGSGRIRLEQAHNDYLDLTASGGIIALGLGAWFAVLLILRARSNFRSPDYFRRAAALGAAAAIVGVAVHSLVDFGLQITGIAVMFVILLTIATAEIRVEKSSSGGRL